MLVVLLYDSTVITMILQFFTSSLAVVFAKFAVINAGAKNFLPLRLNKDTDCPTLFRLTLVLISCPSGLESVCALLRRFNGCLDV